MHRSASPNKELSSPQGQETLKCIMGYCDEYLHRNEFLTSLLRQKHPKADCTTKSFTMYKVPPQTIASCSWQPCEIDIIIIPILHTVKLEKAR